MLTQEELRRVWLSISPIVYFDKFKRWPKKSLMIYGRYDLTFLPEFSVQTAGEFLRRGLDTTIKALPLRSLLAGRDALQIHGRLAHLAIPGEGIRGVRSFSPQRHRGTEILNQFSVISVPQW